MRIYNHAFCCEPGKRANMLSRGDPPDFYNILWGGGVFPIYYNITEGEGGLSWDHKF